MKVSTDSLILGSWATMPPTCRVLDIGCGTGILSLMICQENPQRRHITAIDIDNNAVTQAKQNVGNSPWPQRISVFRCDLKNAVFDEPFDAIICNPPYFRDTNAGTKPHLRQSHERQLARQQPSLTPEMLFAHAARVSMPTASLYCLYPCAQRAVTLTAAQQEGWHLTRELTVYNHAGAVPHVTAYRFSKELAIPQHEVLIIRDENGQYTQQYKTLCQPFYLAF